MLCTIVNLAIISNSVVNISGLISFGSPPTFELAFQVCILQ
jgi:hypothetical protein